MPQPQTKPAFTDMQYYYYFFVRYEQKLVIWLLF